MSSLAMKRVVATALAGAAVASAIGATTASARPMEGVAPVSGAVASPSVPPPPSSLAAPAGRAYEELRAPEQPAVPPPPSSLAASAGGAYEELRTPDQPAVPSTVESQPVADQPSAPSGFDLPSAAIGAVAGAGLVTLLLAAGGLVRRRPLTRRHGTAGA